mmetsp:Transcript_46965/g.114141  ORF Transcript_46965/g.114141 Transcript_46965/m.114141 type:complete len:102 (-) Transcript_46965:6-311(-)
MPSNSDPNSSPVIMATFKNSLPDPLNDFLCKVAVPRHLDLVIGPASTETLRSRGGTMTQTMNLTRKRSDGKPLKMRLLIEYKRGGRAVRETADVTDFPADL